MKQSFNSCRQAIHCFLVSARGWSGAPQPNEIRLDGAQRAHSEIALRFRGATELQVYRLLFKFTVIY
jgi:hypothetical protein